MKPPCFHRRNQACGGCALPLQVSDSSALHSQGVEGELDAEFKSSDAGADAEDVEGDRLGT